MERFNINGIPAALYGEPKDKVFLYIHGKLGCKEEAEALAEMLCPMGYQVLGIDLPEHGERKADGSRLLPWLAVPELRGVYEDVKAKWESVSLYAVSIGAYLSLLALGQEKFEHALFVSPVLDMEKLIGNMMAWSGVSEARLEKEKTIPTDFGETLSWEYFSWAKSNPICACPSPSAILWAGKDELTDRKTVWGFARRFDCRLTVFEEGVHWFHTQEQLEVLNAWIKKELSEQ